MKNQLRLLSILLAVSIGNTALASSVSASTKALDVIKAAEVGDTAKLKKLLKDNKIDLNAQDEEGMTPLMSAAIGGRSEAVKLLLSKKVDLEKKNKVGDTALAVALTNDQYDIGDQLIKAGANVDITVAGDEGDTLLIRVSGDNSKATQTILKWNKALVNKSNKLGETALMRSVQNGLLEATKLLLANGADAKLKNKAGKTALDIAKESNNEEAIKLLTKK
ncbi:ankyrin repeat domain-containing protein [Bdellovibrio bacteriovorus]|uniref:ankyrin repeat domain-containing protein n=1 Tax=Bdellovibrio TaxID=958 RepID=UPI0035A8CF3B